MLSAKTQMSLRNAREYFREHLCVGDYYAEGRQIAGEWFGLGAEDLGLKGKVGEVEFLRLCEGLHPVSGERLTQRMNSTRITEDGGTVANRRVFYDFVVSPPKSVSVVAYLQDDRVLEAHDRAVRIAMAELEKFAETRVRKAGERSDRGTGNLVVASFRHDTSRELDPHLHTHCVVFNATFDQVEGKWKALEAGTMYRAQKYTENLYYHELSKGLRSLGYEIENNSRDFEIKGVPIALLTRFSKRHQQIDAEAEKQLGQHRGDANAVRRFIAHNVRRRKMKHVTTERLRPEWEKQISESERLALRSLRSNNSAPKSANVAAVVNWADKYLFERRSVVFDHELWSASLARGRGDNFDMAALREAIAQRGYVRQMSTGKLTSPEVLRCELDIVMAAKNGRWQFPELNPSYVPSAELSAEQKKAAGQILGSRDFITLFRGGAGTGKSYTLKEIERGLSAAGRSVVVVTPQRQQAQDLQADGLVAETLSALLERKELKFGAVVMVDEAGQIGGRALRELIQLVESRSGRIILSGDTRQHGAVAASDALRAIEKHSGLKAAEIKTIRRQDPKLAETAKERRVIRTYRAAVKAASKGLLADSFDRLNKIGCIRELNTDERREVVAKEYLASLGRKEKTLVVAQTREEVRAVNEAIRQRLTAECKLGVESTVTVCEPIDQVEAQKADARFYQARQQLFFLRGYGRFKKGDTARVISADDRGILIEKEDRQSIFPFRYADRFVVTNRSTMGVAPGDRLQMKFNGKAENGVAISNGELVTVRRVRANGGIEVEDDKGARKTISANQHVFSRGYAVTSYGSQGKTVDTVIVADSGNRAATNAEQWYVSISRGRKRAVIYTVDKEELRRNAQNSGHRELAVDLNPEASAKAEQAIRAEYEQTLRWKGGAREIFESVRLQQFSTHQPFASHQVSASPSTSKIQNSL